MKVAFLCKYFYCKAKEVFFSMFLEKIFNTWNCSTYKRIYQFKLINWFHDDFYSESA